jgi:tetratricopeptide (TPR) repeat protein
LFLSGELLQKRGQLQQALKIYDEVLQRDPDYTPALLKQAWYHYGAANFTEAQQLTEKGLQRDVNNPTLEYAAGVIDRAAQHLPAAKDALWASIHYGGRPAPAFVDLGEISIQEGDYKQAVALLKRALDYDPQDAFALADLAVAERLGGDVNQAAKDSAMAVNIMPLLPYALAEQAQDRQEPSSPEPASGSAEDAWTKVISSDPQNYIAVAAWYHSLGAWQSSDAVLKTAQKNFSAAQQSPMMDFYLASNAWHEGNVAEAEASAKRAAASSVTDSFPNEVTDVAVLREVLDHDPNNPQAQYALGNFLFAHGRYDEAAALWQDAVKGGWRNSVILRNLGLYQWEIKHDLSSAAGYYSAAIGLSPDQYRLYPDLDVIYEQEGNTAAREDLLRKAPAEVLSQDTVRARRAVLLVEQGNYHDALASLDNHVFKPWEGGEAIHEIFVSANIEKGKQALREHHPQQAVEAFRTAMQYPESLGTGEPTHPDLAEQYYWLGVALQAEGKDAEAKSSWTKAAAEAGNKDSGCPVYAGLADQKLGQDQASTELLQKSEEAATHPGAGAGAYICAGVAEQMTGHSDLARSDFQQAISANALDWRARVALLSLNQNSQTEHAALSGGPTDRAQ